MNFLVIAILIAVAAAAVIFLSSSRVPQDASAKAQATDKAGHKLVAQWEEYEKARRADKPKTEEKLLNDIKAAATAARLPWDFYDAATRVCDVVANRNWKLRDSVNRQLYQEVKAFDEPIVTFAHALRENYSSEYKYKYIVQDSARLKAARNPEFYAGLTYSEPNWWPVAKRHIKNDYEFTLWTLSLNYSNQSSSARRLLSPQLDYPSLALLEYSNLGKSGRSDYISRYEGKAVTLLARQDMLWDKFESLKRSGKSTQEDYKELRAECEKYLKERKGFSGEELEIAKCATRLESLAESLDAKYLSASITDSKLRIIFNNIPYAQVTISSGKKNVWKKKVVNPARRYYLSDTVEVNLPAINDGEYDFKASYGDEVYDAIYYKYTISLASREDKGGVRIYAADYQTGEPVKEADVNVKVRKGGSAREKHFLFDGFTPLTKEMAAVVEKGKYADISCEFKDTKGLLHKSGQSSFWPRYEYNPVKVSDVVILTDRAAFRPGETMQFKAVCYETNWVDQIGVCPAGVKIRAEIEDPAGKNKGKLELVTNEFGSVAGSFELKRGEKNGMWTLRIYADQKYLGSKGIRVDDFVLPTFEILFDEDNALHLPGDSVRISGCVKSYSGHPLTGAKLYAGAVDVDGFAKPELEEHTLNEDGTFEFFCKCRPDVGWYNRNVSALVKVVDATGETWEQGNLYPVSRNIGPGIVRSDAPEGNVTLAERKGNMSGILTSDTLEVTASVRPKPGMELIFSVFRKDELIFKVPAEPNVAVSVPVTGPSGLYKIVLDAKVNNDEGSPFSDYNTIEVLKISPSNPSLEDKVENVFVVLPGDDISLLTGASNGRVWAVAELFDSDYTLLESKQIVLSGEPGDADNLCTLSFPYKESYGDYVALQVFYFRNGTSYKFTHNWKRPVEHTVLPLKFTRFEDKTNPGVDYSFLIETSPGVECAAAIFDKSTEKIRPNYWPEVRLSTDRSVYVNYSVFPGKDRTEMPEIMYEAMGRNMRVEKAVMRSSAAAPAMGSVVEEDGVVAEYSAQMLTDDASVDTGGVDVRENFASTVTFQPFLRSDQFGLARLDFTNTDKLSTYVVQLYAHDPAMHNSVLRQEMVVSVPVKVALTEPQFLFAGDKYFLKATLSSLAEKDIPGKVVVEGYDGNSWRESPRIIARSATLTAHAGKQEAFECEIDVPEVSTLGLKVCFVPDDPSEGADAVFVPIPVYEPVQTLTEAHSAILKGGADEAALIAKLRKEFVNVNGADADVKVISILDMVREALPDMIQTSCKDVLSTSAALYAGLLSRSIDPNVIVDVSGLEQKVLKCRCDDGGFGWFEGMASSPILTSVVLQRLYLMDRKGLLESVPALKAMVTDAVRFLDKCYFGDSSVPEWRGGISLAQYLYVRSLFVEVPFGAKNVSAKRWKEFRKEAGEYLMPKTERGLRGAILAKARRCETLRNLSCDAAGLFSDTPLAADLLKEWGISLSKADKLRASYVADVESLVEYAVDHPHRGMYYPNAVMPWRGLMESELAAHVTMVSLLDNAGAVLPARNAECCGIAEGIRFWMMIQKETQKWGTDPAFIEAIAAVLAGSEQTLQTKVVALSKTYTKPFERIKASGNGFKVSRKYLRDGRVLRDGDVLKVGDRITAEYSIWNAENRSFVRLYAPRPASLRPVDQLSGYRGWWTWTQGYRNVLSDRTEYWYDAYPEENTTVREDFYVTQKGTFRAPVVSIESLYAPHYRANGTAAKLVSKD